MRELVPASLMTLTGALASLRGQSRRVPCAGCRGERALGSRSKVCYLLIISFYL